MVIVVLALAMALPAAQSRGQSEPAVVIKMEGATHELHDIDWTVSSVTMEGEEIRYYLTEDDNPVSLNLNLANTGILETGSATYQLPEANHGEATIDLNFFNRDREGKRMQRRIVFNEGTIEIHELTANSLRMTFAGSGHPLMADETFPIEGSVDVRFPSP
jgi:hypothetical protein